MLCRNTAKRGFTLIELLVVMAIIGVLIALLLPAVQACRAAARRTQCINNMMQIGIGLQNYEVAFETFPPGVVNPTGPIANKRVGYHFSWLAQMLPFLEHKNIYNHLNFQHGAYAAVNLTARAVTVQTFLCPSDPTGPGGWSNYAGNHNHDEAAIDVTNTGLLFLNSRIRTEDISDGASHTIAFGERLGTGAGGFPDELGWASGTRATLRNGGTPINGIPVPSKKHPDPVGGFGSLHPGGSDFCFADGSVKFLKSSGDLKFLQLQLNRDDGEMIMIE